MARGDRAPAAGSSWLAHAIFYGLQAILATAAGVLIFTEADPRIARARLQADTNIVGDNPGLSFRPMDNGNSGLPSSIISYRVSDQKSWRPIVESLEDVVKAYKMPGLLPSHGQNIYNCDYNKPPPPGGVCDVDVKGFGRCIPENNFDYHRGSPCVFLKLSTPRGWRPVFYNDIESLPDAMPSDLKKYIVEKGHRNPVELDTVWVSCEGEHPADIELMGPIQMIPSRGFPGYFFFTEENEDYLSPLVVVHFERPRSGVLINIKCKAWARNIKHDNETSLGGVRFGLMLD